MNKIGLIVIIFSILLMGCSSDKVTTQQNSKTKHKEEKLSKIDKIAKNMLEGDTDTTELVTDKNLPKDESDLLFNYGELNNYLDRVVENNEISVNDNINSAISMRIQNIINNRVNANGKYKYLDRLIDKKINPLLNLWHSNEVDIGMSEKDLLISCGVPIEINRTVTSNGSSEQWVYPSQYVYVEDGEVTSFQD